MRKLGNFGSGDVIDVYEKNVYVFCFFLLLLLVLILCAAADAAALCFDYIPFLLFSSILFIIVYL